MAHSSNSNDIINEAKKTDLPTYTIIFRLIDIGMP